MTFADAKLKINETRDVVAVAPIGDGRGAGRLGGRGDPRRRAGDLETAPAEGATFDPRAEGGRRARRTTPRGRRRSSSWLAGSQTLDLHRHAGLKLTSTAGESERDFRIRVQDAQREARDAEVDAVRRKFAEKRARLEEKAAPRGAGRARASRSRPPPAKVQTAVSMGATVLGALLRPQDVQREHARPRHDRRARRRPRLQGAGRREAGAGERRRREARRSRSSTRRSRKRPRRSRRATTRRRRRSRRCRSRRSAARCSCSPSRWGGNVREVRQRLKTATATIADRGPPIAI